MVVSVDFCGAQRALTRTDKIEVQLSGKTRVKDIFIYIRKKYPDLSLSKKAVLATVNQELADFNRVLRANDKVSFLPHIGGG
jgi:molybdopterin converting factor small subunit